MWLLCMFQAIIPTFKNNNKYYFELKDMFTVCLGHLSHYDNGNWKS